MDIARAVVILLVMVLLLLLLLLLLTNLTVRDRRNGSESMRRIHGCKAAAWYKWSIRGA
jgi:DMSO/TMAO reductase YedYZ heme-binding membrane subunit